MWVCLLPYGCDGGPVLVIRFVRAADAADSGHALFEGGEPAGRAVPLAVLCAPRIILRLGARVNRGCYYEKPEYKEKIPHFRSPGLRWPLVPRERRTSARSSYLITITFSRASAALAAAADQAFRGTMRE